jgi:hypothetical protein
VRPDHLLDLGEYKAWRDQNNKQKDLEETNSGYRNTVKECLDAPRVVPSVFPLVSKKAWLETLLQTLKVYYFINYITVFSKQYSEMILQKGLCIESNNSEILQIHDATI